MEKDLALIAGDFLDGTIPKEKHYLLKYFRSDITRQFLAYYLRLGGNVKWFNAHTGCHMSPSFFSDLKVRLCKIEDAHEDAKRNGDFTAVAEIESGNFDC